jgi:RNA polymerase sigma-70 factor (ECF subfamily)
MKGADNSSGREEDALQSRSTSVTLLEQVKQRDKPSQERLMDLYRPLVLYWCRAKGVHRHQDTEDLTQEVFATVFSKIGGFTKGEQPGSFRAWLRSITRNKVGDYIRKARHWPSAAGGSEAQAILAEVPDPSGEGISADEDSVERGILHHSALELLRQEFEPKTLEAARRTVVDGQGAAAVAAALGMTANAVFIAKSRVLKRLREEMDKFPD